MSTVEGELVNLLAEVFERLTAKHTSISYDFKMELLLKQIGQIQKASTCQLEK
jgi:hypothetical protein